MKNFLEVQVEKLVYGGMGLAKIGGKKIFIPYVCPGEKILAEIVEARKDYLVGRVSKVLEASVDRVPSPCPYFYSCGGCQWQHLSYAAQLLWKQSILEETLTHVGKIEGPCVLPTIPSPQIWGWRSRVTIHSNGNGKVGFFERESHRVVDIDHCLVATDGVNRKLSEVRGRLKSQKGDHDLREGEGVGFSQANEAQNGHLKALVQAWAQGLPHDHILELFCGNGNFSEVLIPMVGKFVGVDADVEAIQFADRLVNGLHKSQVAGHKTQFVCADAAKFIQDYAVDLPLDLLVLDPPRDGFARVTEGAMRLRPRHILYISCNPATLARDVGYLTRMAGYKHLRSQPVDMFPMSFHIESATLMASPLPR